MHRLLVHTNRRLDDRFLYQKPSWQGLLFSVLPVDHSMPVSVIFFHLLPVVNWKNAHRETSLKWEIKNVALLRVPTTGIRWEDHSQRKQPKQFPQPSAKNTRAISAAASCLHVCFNWNISERRSLSRFFATGCNHSAILSNYMFSALINCFWVVPEAAVGSAGRTLTPWKYSARGVLSSCFSHA